MIYQHGYTNSNIWFNTALINPSTTQTSHMCPTGGPGSMEIDDDVLMRVHVLLKWDYMALGPRRMWYHVEDSLECLLGLLVWIPLYVISAQDHDMCSRGESRGEGEGRGQVNVGVEAKVGVEVNLGSTRK